MMNKDLRELPDILQGMCSACLSLVLDPGGREGREGLEQTDPHGECEVNEGRNRCVRHTHTGDQGGVT